MKIKYYVNKWGRLIEFWQNPCGCHPFDVLITYSNDQTFGKGKSVTVSFRNHQHISAYARKFQALK